MVSIFLLSLALFMSHLRWLCLTQCHRNLLIFFSKSFIVLPLTFKLVIHLESVFFFFFLESIFVHSVRNGFNFIFFTWPSSCSITICWKDYSPLNCYGMWVKKLIDHKCLGLFLGFQFYSIDLHVILMSTCYFCFCCSVAQLSLTLCDPIDWCTPGSSVLHYLQEFAQIHFHWVGDAISPSHLLLPPSFAFNLSQHWGLFQWVSSLIQVAKVLELQLQHQSFQWIFRIDVF